LCSTNFLKSLGFKVLMAFFVWLSFKSQLAAAPTGYVIVALKDLGNGKIHPRKVTNARKQSRVVVLGEQRRSEDQRLERTVYSTERLILRLTDRKRGGWF